MDEDLIHGEFVDYGAWVDYSIPDNEINELRMNRGLPDEREFSPEFMALARIICARYNALVDQGFMDRVIDYRDSVDA